MDLDAFLSDTRTDDAVLLNLQVIGESVKNLPQSVHDHAPDIEWRQIAGLRDIIAHTYFRIEGPIIWDIIITKVSPLQIAINHLIADFPK